MNLVRSPHLFLGPLIEDSTDSPSLSLDEVVVPTSWGYYEEDTQSIQRSTWPRVSLHQCGCFYYLLSVTTDYKTNSYFMYHPEKGKKKNYGHLNGSTYLLSNRNVLVTKGIFLDFFRHMLSHMCLQ